MNTESPLKTGRVVELSIPDRLNLAQFASSSYFDLVCKIMESEIIEARDDAMEIDPAEEAKQKAAMTKAHAMALFYTRFRKKVENAINEHLGELKQKAIELDLQDQTKMEEIIVSQAANS